MSTHTILAIETSCDETSIAILSLKNSHIKLLSNEVSSQIKLHAKWGGVVPNLAAREHVKNITHMLNISLKNSLLKIENIDAIAVTQGPGLIPALLVGNTFAKTMAYLLDKPLLGIHHIEGHIYANFIDKDLKKIKFPALALVVSGGHTQIILMKNHFKYEVIGQTLDDAVGEAFDKVARILNIGYPGGPIVSKYADRYAKLKNKPYKITFPRPMISKGNYNFSFSGLKTAVLYETKKNPNLLKDKLYLESICYEFQQAAIDVLINKSLKACEQYKPKTVMLAGGVSANKKLREQLGSALANYSKKITYLVPEFEFTGDNAAMIAAPALLRWQKMNATQKKKTSDNWKQIQPDANLKLK